MGDEDPNGPLLSNVAPLRSAAPADGAGVVARVQVSDPQELADIAGVSLDASALGWGQVSLRDDGRSNDGAAGDGLFGAVFTVAPGTPRLHFVDDLGRSGADGTGSRRLTVPEAARVPGPQQEPPQQAEGEVDGDDEEDETEHRIYSRSWRGVFSTPSEDWLRKNL